MIQSNTSGYTPGGPQYADVNLIFRVLLRHWLFIGSLVTLLSVVAVFIAYSLTPVYKSTVTLILESDKSSVSNVASLFDESDYNFIHFETQRNLITSNDLLLKVVDRLSLSDQDVFSRPLTKPWWQGDWKELLPHFEIEPQVLSEEEVALNKEKYALSELRRAVTVTSIPFTELLRIEVMLASPELAALVANEVALVYVESGLEARFDKAKSANFWVADRVQDLKTQLARSEGLLQEYLETNRLTDVGGIKGLVEADIQANTSNLLVLKKSVAVLKNVVRKIELAKGSLDRLQDIQRLVTRQVVQDTRRDYQAAQQMVSRLASRYGPRHPKIITAQAAVDEARAVYHEQLKLEAENVLTEYQLAKQSVNDIRGFTAENKQQLSKLGRQSYELRSLQRDVDLNRQMYDLFLTKMKETDITGSFNSVNARVIDPAEIARTSTEPRKKKIVGVTFLLSLFLGIGLVLLRYFLDNKVATPEQYAELVAPASVLCSVPSHGRVNWKQGSKAVSKLLTKDRAFGEAMRTLRTNIQLCEVDKINQVVMIGSAVPGEGKTTISIGLASAFAQIGKVLLIETDLRKPTLVNRLSLPKGQASLVEYLLGNAELGDAIIRVEALNLDVLAVGVVPPNPQEMLQSNKFVKLIDELRGQYDRIIIDSAPVLAVADAQILVKDVDGVVLVSRADQTHKHNMLDAVGQFRLASEGCLLGGVINGVDISKLNRYYGKKYQQYYDYYV